MQTPPGGGTPQTAAPVPVSPTAGSYSPQQSASSAASGSQFQSPFQTRANQQFAPSGVTGRTILGNSTQAAGQFNPAFVPGFVPEVPVGIGFDVGDQGLTISTLAPTGVFVGSGLRVGDVIVSSAGQTLQSQEDFLKMAALYAGQSMPIVVLREGQRQTIDVAVPKDFQQANSPGGDPRAQRRSQSYLGVIFNPGTPDAAVVASVNPGSPAEVAGLRAGDMIASLNCVPVKSAQHAMQILSVIQPGDRVDISFSRVVQNQTRAILESRPMPAAQTATASPAEHLDAKQSKP